MENSSFKSNSSDYHGAVIGPLEPRLDKIKILEEF